MAVTGFIFGSVFLAAFNEEIDWLTDSAIKLMLMTSSYTPAQTHDYKDDITNEVAGSGYSAGGKAITSPTITYTSGTGILKMDAADVSWTASTITARYCALYDEDSGGADSSRPLIIYQDFGADVSTNNGTFTIAWHADGIVEITVTIT